MSSLKFPAEEDTYRSIGYALKRAQQALRGHLDAHLRDIGLTMPQYSVLAGLESSDGMSNADLARRAFVTPQTMQGIIVGLEREGLIGREAHPDHGRVLTATLTKDGRDKVQAAHIVVARAEVLARNAIAPADPALIYASLLRIADAMT